MAIFIKVKVFAGARKEEVAKKADDSFEVHVKEKPERGEANRAVAAALAAYLNISESHLKLIKGRHRRNKIFKLTG